MKFRKIAALMLAGMMTVSATACSGSTPATPSEPATQTETKETKETTPETTEETTPDAETPSTDGGADLSSASCSLDMWCIATESDSNRHSYEAAIEEMASEYPGITLSHILIFF